MADQNCELEDGSELCDVGCLISSLAELCLWQDGLFLGGRNRSVETAGYYTSTWAGRHEFCNVEEPNSKKLPNTKFHVNLSAVYVLLTEYAGRRTDVMRTPSHFLCKYSSQMRHESFVLGSACCVCAWRQIIQFTISSDLPHSFRSSHICIQRFAYRIL